jgi:hypothetical protein
LVQSEDEVEITAEALPLPHALVMAAEIPIPPEMLARVLRAGWWDYPGGRVKMIDIYCQTCRKLLERIRYLDEDTGRWELTPCATPEWLHGGPVGTRKKRTAMQPVDA